MDRLGEGHERGGGSAGEGAAEILDAIKVVAEEKQLGDRDANDGRQHLAEERIARLRKRRLYGVEFEDSGRALVTLVSGYANGQGGDSLGRECSDDLQRIQQWPAHDGSQTRERAWRRPG